MINNVCITGRLTKDVNIQQVKNFYIADINIVNNYYYNNKIETNYFNVNIFIKDSQIDYYKKNFTKGKLITAGGVLRQNRYKDKTGQQHDKIYILANKIDIQVNKENNSSYDDFDI